jgi:hypothetical protein
VERIERSVSYCIVPAIGCIDGRNPTKYSVKVVAVRLKFEAGTSRIQSRRAEFLIPTSVGPYSERLELTSPWSSTIFVTFCVTLVHYVELW